MEHRTAFNIFTSMCPNPPACCIIGKLYSCPGPLLSHQFKDPVIYLLSRQPRFFAFRQPFIVDLRFDRFTPHRYLCIAKIGKSVVIFFTEGLCVCLVQVI